MAIASAVHDVPPGITRRNRQKRAGNATSTAFWTAEGWVCVRQIAQTTGHRRMWNLSCPPMN